MADILNIADYTKKDGPWFVFQDPVTKSVHVVPIGLIKNWIAGEVKIEKPEHFEVIRAIISEWCDLKLDSIYYETEI